MGLLTRLLGRPAISALAAPLPAAEAPAADDVVPIGSVRWRQRVRVAGRVRSVRIQPWSGVPTLECTLVDDSGGLLVVFLGRRDIPGIHPGTRMVVQGMVGEQRDQLAILNPDYQLLP